MRSNIFNFNLISNVLLTFSVGRNGSGKSNFFYGMYHFCQIKFLIFFYIFSYSLNKMDSKLGLYTYLF